MSGFYESKKEREYQEKMSKIFPDEFKVTDRSTEESMYDFSLEPVSFEEAAENLCRDAETLFRMTASKNRLSGIFLETTRTLEKVIRKLGSCCMTKAVLEAKGIELPSLDGLDIEKLYCLGSFNIRKCHASIRDGISKTQKFNIAMLNAECSWFSTLEQLKATEDRIQLIREGRINADDLIRRTEMLGGGGRSDTHSRKEKTDAARKAASFPILRSVLKEYDISARDTGISTHERSGIGPGAGIYRAPRPYSPMSPAEIMRMMQKDRMEKPADGLPDAKVKSAADGPSESDKAAEAEAEKCAQKVWEAYFGKKNVPPEAAPDSGPGLVRHENGTRKKKKRKKR